MAKVIVLLLLYLLIYSCIEEVIHICYMLGTMLSPGYEQDRKDPLGVCTRLRKIVAKKVSITNDNVFHELNRLLRGRKNLAWVGSSGRSLEREVLGTARGRGMWREHCW